MQDALRRLFTAGELTPADLDELAEVCKTKHGLASTPPTPLSAAHVPVAGSGPLEADVTATLARLAHSLR